MKILRNAEAPLFLTVEGAPEELQLIGEALTFADKKEQDRYQRALQDPNLRYAPKMPEITTFFDRENLRFFAGHLGIVTHFCQIRGIDLELPPEKVDNDIEISFPKGEKEYRPYQIEAIAAAVRKGSGIIQAGTGAGKMLIAAGIIHNSPGPALYLTPQMNLCPGVVEEFRLSGLHDLGLISGSTISFGQVIVSDPKTLSRVMKRDKNVRKWLKTVRTVVADECQGVPSASYSSVIMATAQAEFRFGLSGTPWQDRVFNGSLRDVHVLGVFGEVIFEVPVIDLINQGYLARAKIYMLPVEQPQVIVPKSRGAYGADYTRVYREGVVTHATRNNLATQAIYLLTKVQKLQTLVLVQHIEHGQQMLERLTAMGVDAVFIKGASEVYFQDDPRNPRKDKIIGTRLRTVNQFADREYQVMIGTVGTFGVGYDLPGDMVEAMVLLAGGKGLIPVLQRLGRALRPKPNGADVVVIDFDDQTHYYLIAQSKKRRNEYTLEGHTVEGMQEFRRDLLHLPPDF